MDNDLILTTEMFEEAEKYWRDNLSGELIELYFPADYNKTGQYEKGNLKLTFDEQTPQQLRQISKDNNFLLNVIFLTVFKILIHKFTGQNDIIVSSSVLKTGNQNYNKCIALRDFLSPGMTFKELLLKVKETAADGYKYQYYPIRKLIKLLKIGNPMVLFKFIFLLDNIHEEEFTLDLTGNGENDIIFSVSKNDTGLEGEITYNSNLFKEETIQHFCSGYNRILTQVLSDSNIKLSAINTITEDEKKEILVDFNNTLTEYPKDKTLHQLFEEQVKQRGDNICSVEMGSSRLNNIHCISYAELNERANRLAMQLVRRGVLQGSIISLMIGHSIDLPVGILGILKAGLAYLPLDPDYPAERINFMLNDSGSQMLLITADLTDKCEAVRFAGEMIEIKDGEIAGLEESRPLTRLTAPTDPAYVIYTSGSTGMPKGVLVEHRNVVRLVKNMNYIDFSEEDRMLPTGIIAFDITTFEIWGPLLNDTKLYFVDEPVILDPERLAKVINENEITILHLTPQLLSQTAAQKIEIFAGLRYLLVGGDVVKPAYINKVRDKYKNLKILQMYGPTENTTFTTYFPVDKNYEVSLPIGKPVANSTVYILDRFFNLQAKGIAGELCTGGDGIARGYLNSPELTAEKFVSNPFDPGARLYRTGDLARWLPDGNIEFLGRNDNQVKIRGYRIELGEIERVLSAHEKIEDAIIVIKKDEEENPYLCAYFTSGEEITISELRKYLAGRLPDYMMPLFFVPLDKMPLTPNGKIDRKALPEPKIKKEIEYTAPCDEVEKKLVDIWAEVLRIEKDVIGIDDNFFQLGGHSLKVTIMIFSVYKELKVKLSMDDVFKTPTIRELAGYIKSAEAHEYSKIEPAEKKEYYPLSSAQKRLYILQKMNLDSMAYNMPGIIPLPGGAEPGKIAELLKKLIKRHESLRTSFHIVHDIPVQKIHENVESEIEILQTNIFAGDSIGGGGFSKKVPWLPEIMIKNFVRPFDLSLAPLLRVGLVKNSDGSNILLVDMHHIISDGISQEVLAIDFTRLYGEQALSPLRLTYKDYSEWLNNQAQMEVLKQQENYWLSEFKGKIALLDMPLDYERTGEMHFQGSSICFQIDDKLTAKIKESVIRFDVTLMVFLFTLYNILLAACACKEEVIVGTVTAGRRHVDLQNIIGFFVNMLAIKTFPGKDKTFSQYLSEVKEKAFNAFENQEYPFDELVSKLGIQREPGRHPLVDMVFVFLDENNYGEESGIPSSDELLLNPMNISHFDLMLHATDKGEFIFLLMEYSTALFKRATIEGFARVYLEILEQVLENNDIRLADIDISHNFLLAKSDFIQGDTEDWEL